MKVEVTDSIQDVYVVEVNDDSTDFVNDALTIIKIYGKEPTKTLKWKTFREIKDV
jgi:hypothetical protein